LALKLHAEEMLIYYLVYNENTRTMQYLLTKVRFFPFHSVYYRLENAIFD